jgi:hypothetical protein
MGLKPSFIFMKAVAEKILEVYMSEKTKDNDEKKKPEDTTYAKAANEEKDENNSSIVNIPLNLGKPLRKNAKLTAPKRRIFLELLLQNWNISMSATMIGVTREAIFALKERDPHFKSAMNRVHQCYLDKLENVSLTVASQPTREGFNDRKLQLMAHRDEYKQKPLVQLNQQFNYNEGEIDSILTRILPDADKSKTS